MIQDIKDRLPTKPNTWEVTHSDSTVEEVTVARADEPTEAGTPINRALFRNLQGDLYTIDRSVTPTATVDNGTVKMSVDLPLTSYETGKLIRLRMPSVSGTWTGDYIPYERLGLEEITASSESASYPKYNAIDGSTSTYWTHSDAEYQNVWVQLKFGTAIKITKMKTLIKGSSSQYFSSAKIQGSNNGTSWTDLYSIPSSQSTLTEITLNNNTAYTYYRVLASATASSRKIHITELQVTEYEGNVFWAYNPQININSLGFKSINGTLHTGEDYLLRYNGTQWEICNKYVSGTFTVSGVGTTAVNLGFRPKLVIIYSKENSSVGTAISSTSATKDGIPIIITDAYGVGLTMLTSTGFSLTETANISGTLYYIAIGG
jgi:hypothetical protein